MARRGVDLNTLLILAGIGIGGYVLVKALGGLKKVTDGTSSAIANTWAALTLPGADVPQGSVILPDGRAVSMAQLSATGSVQPTTQSDGNPGVTFVWQGARYWINSPSDATGVWQAWGSADGGMDFGMTPSTAPGGW